VANQEFESKLVWAYFEDMAGRDGEGIVADSQDPHTAYRDLLWDRTTESIVGRRVNPGEVSVTELEGLE
jgi:hypothetical protein